MATPQPTPTIKITEDLHPARTATGDVLSPSLLSPGAAGGVFPIRRAQTHGSFARTTSHLSPTDGGEEGDVWQKEETKQKQVFRGRTLLWYFTLVLVD